MVAMTSAEVKIRRALSFRVISFLLCSGVRHGIWHYYPLSYEPATFKDYSGFHPCLLPGMTDTAWCMGCILNILSTETEIWMYFINFLNWFLREVTGTISDENFVKPHNDSSSSLTDFVSTTAPCRHQAIRNHYYTESFVKCVTRDSYYETYIWQRTYSVAAIRLIRIALELERKTPLIARFMGPTWGPSGADRTQVGPMLAPWTLLSRTS